MPTRAPLEGCPAGAAGQVNPDTVVRVHQRLAQRVCDPLFIGDLEGRAGRLATQATAWCCGGRLPAAAYFARAALRGRLAGAHKRATTPVQATAVFELGKRILLRAHGMQTSLYWHTHLDLIHQRGRNIYVCIQAALKCRLSSACEASGLPWSRTELCWS